MLRFSGIHIINNQPEKYKIQYMLLESYQLAAQLLQQNGYDLTKSIEFSKNTINQLYENFSKNDAINKNALRQDCG